MLYNLNIQMNIFFIDFGSEEINIEDMNTVMCLKSAKRCLSPSLISLMVCVDVKHHDCLLKTCPRYGLQRRTNDQCTEHLQHCPLRNIQQETTWHQDPSVPRRRSCTGDLAALRRTVYGEPGSPKQDCVRGTWQP